MKYLSIIVFCLFISNIISAQEISVVPETDLIVSENGQQPSEPEIAIPDSSYKYRIGDIKYNITGATKEYSLSLITELNTGKLFLSKQNIDAYIAEKERLLQNQRVLQSALIIPSYSEPDEYGVITVNLEVITVDTWNIIGFPYPKYDSNNGFELKLKLKNYNFFGSMQTLNTDVIYEYVNEDGYAFSGHRVGGNIDFKIPFNAWGIDSVWDLSASIEWPIGENPDISFGTGIGISIPFEFVSIDIAVEQSFHMYDRDDDGNPYTDDWLYFTEKASISFPFVLGEIPHWGEVIWKPNFSVSYNWDIDGIRNEDLKGPSFNFGHSLSTGRENWIGNFRHGFTASLNNSYAYNIGTDNIVYPSLSITLKGFYSIPKVGIASRFKWFGNFNNFIKPGKTSDSVASDIRGIYDNKIETDMAFVFNLDIPISIFTTDWVKWTGQSWMKYLDFEIQISPFFDMALVHDMKSNSYFSFENGRYGSGIELLIYPAKMRSLVGRISIGIDLQKKTDDKFEFFLGIGSFY